MIERGKFRSLTLINWNGFLPVRLTLMNWLPRCPAVTVRVNPLPWRHLLRRSSLT
ncbi:chromosome partition mukB domain protein [Shigella flexneri 1235-66]|nr:chromosome partition mukB domain protein [Shigella flexneri 1235-66]